MVKQLGSYYKRHVFLWSSAVFVALSLCAAGLNYAYYPVIAHILPPSSFGAAQVLIAILLQISAIFSGLNLVVIYLVHVLDANRARQTIETLQKLTISIFVILTALVIVGQHFILQFLHLDRELYLLIVGVDLITTVPFVLTYGYLQAHKQFLAAGCLQITVVATKLILGALATLQWGVAGALIGFALGQIVGMAIYWFGCKLSNIRLWEHDILRSLVPPSGRELAALRPQAAPIVSIFIVNVILVLFISFDIIAARHYFVPSLSGLYAGASTLSNAIVFVCIPLIGVLLPHLHTHQLRLSRSVFGKTFSMVLGVSVAAVIVLALLPKPLLSVFGSQYTVFSYLLWRLGVLMSLLSMATLLLQVSAFYDAWRTAIITVLALLGLISLVITHHQTPQAMVSALMIGFTGIVLVSLVQVARVYGQKR